MIDPRFMSAVGWAAHTTILISQFGTIPRLAHENGWKQWANVVSGLPALAAVGAPRPDRGRNWRAWAAAFNLAVERLGVS